MGIKSPKSSLTIMTDSVLPGETNPLNNLFGVWQLKKIAKKILKVIIKRFFEITVVIFIQIRLLIQLLLLGKVYLPIPNSTVFFLKQHYASVFLNQFEDLIEEL